MIHSLRRSSSKTKTRPSLVGFTKNWSAEQENWVPAGDTQAHYNIPQQSYEHSLYNQDYRHNSLAKRSEDCHPCYENSYHMQGALLADRGLHPNNNNNYYHHQQNKGSQGRDEVDDDLSVRRQHLPPSNSISRRESLCSRRSRRGSTESKQRLERGSGYRYPASELDRNKSFRPQDRVKHLGQTGTITKTVGGVMKRRKHIVLLGLDGSGKTTILMQLKYKSCVATAPTVGFNHEKVWGGGFRWSVWDVGGGERVRALWSTYTRGTDGIVFVVDAAANTDTMEEARLELARIIKFSKSTALQLNKQCPPLLVLANFQDNSMARCAPEVAECLFLPQEESLTWAVACVCALTGEGLDEAMATLRQLMDQNTNTKQKHNDRWRF